MKWVRTDANARTIIRRQLEGYTLELTTPTGRNRSGPRLISFMAALRLITLPGCGFRRVE